MTDYAGTATYATTIDLPDDGDAASASSVDVPLEGLADRTEFLKAGLLSLDASNVDYWTDDDTTANDIYTDHTAWTWGGGAAVPTVEFTSCQHGDKIILTGCFHITIEHADPATYRYFGLRLTYRLNGAGSWLTFTGNEHWFVQYETALKTTVSFTCAFMHTLTSEDDIEFRLEGKVNASGETLTLYGGTLSGQRARDFS
jgi:hypothetical protein